MWDLLEIRSSDSNDGLWLGSIAIKMEEAEWIHQHYAPTPPNLKHKGGDLYVVLVVHTWYGKEKERVLLDPLILEGYVPQDKLPRSKQPLILDAKLSTRRVDREFLSKQLERETRLSSSRRTVEEKNLALYWKILANLFLWAAVLFCFVLMIVGWMRLFGWNTPPSNVVVDHGCPVVEDPLASSPQGWTTVPRDRSGCIFRSPTHNICLGRPFEVRMTSFAFGNMFFSFAILLCILVVGRFRLEYQLAKLERQLKESPPPSTSIPPNTEYDPASDTFIAH